MQRKTGAPLSLVFGLFFFSGASALVYQVVWLRLLILIFGSTLFATSAILSTFMGGLALGAWLAGRTMDRSTRSPLRIYGILEIGIGIYALAVPLLFASMSPVYRWVWNAGGADSMVMLNAAKFAGIAVVLIIPTTLMGASLPVLARDVADDPDRIGGKVGTLYAINTFGAVAGTFCAGFWLIPTFGVQTTLWATAAINAALGVVAVVLGKRPARASAAARTEAPTRVPQQAPGAEGAAVSRRGVRVLLIVFALSGFGAMVLEVAWTRALALVLGSSVYAYSLMLLAFLVGLAAGGAFFAGILRRRPTIDPGRMLVGLLTATGALAFASTFLFGHMPRWFGEIYFTYHPSPNQWFVVQFLFGFAVMFPATFAFGGIFPAVLQSHARSLDRVAGSVGTVYASNTAGTIAGAACAGFVLIPNLGAQTTVTLTAASQVLLAALVLATVARAAPGWRGWGAATLLVVAAFFPAFEPEWDPLLMNSGVYMNLQDLPADADWSDFEEMIRSDSELVYAKEGMVASVLVADQPSIGNRYLSVNGKVEASTHADMETQLMCAHLPLLLHEDPKEVMVIGLASGITVGAATTHPIDHVRVVEVEQAMIPAAKLFSEYNHDIFADDRVTFSINDARNELEFAERAYDVIISEPSNPWMTVASNLFTEDFFKMARLRLEEDGFFLQWVQTYYLPTEDLRSIIAAFRSAFPNVMVFETFEGVDLLMLGSEGPLALDLPRIRDRMRELQVRMDLARIEVRAAEHVLPLFLLGPDEVDRLVEGAPRNTDDNARVEFSAPKALYMNTLERNIGRLRDIAADPFDYITPVPETEEARDRILAGLAEAWYLRGDFEQARRYALEVAADGPHATEAREILDAIDAWNARESEPDLARQQS